ncbi:MAG: proton-conducting transporter membrane subunit [Polyangiales bacterium]|jgi:NADH:ubiquinone oxidoreductase subunit 5 (subunit L)/multisubunit Na+/H+ antiporter MnhA subunit
MEAIVSGSVICIVGFPVLAVFVLGLRAWLYRPWSERVTVVIVGTAFGASLAACAITAGWLLVNNITEARVPLGTWFSAGHYSFDWNLIADHLSIPFAAFSATLLGVVAAFSRRYLHRESGFARFYLLLAVFGAAVEFVVLAGSLDLVFLGWELVGMTSALLIAFFHERRGPVEHGLRAFVTYRLCDVGLLAASIALHYMVGTSDVVASPSGPWAGFVVPGTVAGATLVGLLILWASMGKAAQVPLSGWLPRAMEGPTPSSAVFYGALSIHLGPYLLLRAASILEVSGVAAGAVIAVGALTALHATFVGRTQSDIKSALAYASMTQVGLIYVEIGLGFYHLAVAHIVGHAAIRTLQILRSPSLLHDHHHLEQAMGKQLPRTGGHLERLVPNAFQPWLYRVALERGGFDAFLRDHVVGRALRVVSWVDRLDQAWVDFLTKPTPAKNERRQHDEVTP